MAPKVSIAIPVYNGGNFVVQAIQSAVEQDLQDIEVIVCDNASNDRTPEICRAFARRWPNVEYHRNPRNIGAGPNFNKAFHLSTGKYFQWVAHDDWLSANYARRCAKALDQAPDAVLAHGVTQCVNEAGRPIDRVGRPLRGLQAESPLERFATVINGGLACFEIFGLIASEALSKTDLHQSYQGSDRALLAELALLGMFVHVPDAQLFNREHQGRSIRINDRRERLRWQDERSARQVRFPRWSLLRHYLRLVFKHLDGADRIRGLLLVARWATRRKPLLQLAVDLVWVISPSAAIRLRKFAWELWWRYRSIRPAHARR